MNILKKKIKYKIQNGILRFVKNKNYAANFGYQWDVFRKTQIDNFHTNVSKKRLLKQTEWKKNQFSKNTIILEAGSGAGRFTRAFLDNFSGKLVSVDLSNAVLSNKKNNLKYFVNKRLYLYQADIANLPFQNEIFDKTFCFGVLQHTPNVKKTLKELILKTKKKGSIVVDFYPYKGFWTLISAKYFLRPITKRMSKEHLLKILKKTTPLFFKFHIFFKKIGLSFLTRFLPICDPNTIPKSIKKSDKMDWLILDTFDMFSAYYDNRKELKILETFLLKIIVK